jgi:molecular chaperone GrpE
MADTEQDITQAPDAPDAPGQDERVEAPAGQAPAGQAPVGASHRAGGAGERGPCADGEGAPEDGDAAAIEGELDEMVKTAAERDQYLALAQRTQADFENYRKRVARDAAQAQDRGVAKLAKELLPALDNLDRAIEAAEAEDPLLAGVRLVRAELAAALARVGIEAFAPLGEPFDPNRHEAVAHRPMDGAAAGTVAEVFQNGYRMGETVIRPARVLVAA